MSSLEFSLGWGLDIPASLENLALYAATVTLYCAPLDAAGVGDGAHFSRRIAFRLSRGKKMVSIMTCFGGEDELGTNDSAVGASQKVPLLTNCNQIETI